MPRRGAARGGSAAARWSCWSPRWRHAGVAAAIADFDRERTMPRITLLFASLHALLLLALLARISRHRHGRRIGFGDGGDPLLARKIRVHGNFIEHVPMALLLMALLESCGLPAPWLWALGTTLLLGRALHAIGLSGSAGYSFGRFYGTALTWLVLLAMALAGAWLALAALFH
jgi:uncharacterized membrane protein YecN with MAPEG domain